MNKFKFIPLIVFLILALFATNGYAQETRTVTGIVTNEAGEPIESALITVIGISHRTTNTDKNGLFSIEKLPFSEFSLQVRHVYCHTATIKVKAGEENEKIHIQLVDKLFGLPEVEVIAYTSETPFIEASYSAMKMGIPIMKFPGSIEVLTKKRLEDQQALTFTEALRNISGISTASAGEANNVSEVFVSRGFKLGNSRNYFRDGMRYRKVSNTPIAGIDRIEFLRGPASVLYGSVEPGGIINIITSPTQYTPRYSTTFRIGSYGLKQASADLTGPLTASKNVRYRLNAMYEYADSYRKEVNSKRFSISPKIDFDLSTSTTLGIRANYFSDDRVVDPGVVHQNGEVISNGDKIFVAEPWAKSKYKTFDLGYILKHQFSNNWKWNSQFSYTKLFEDRLYFQIKAINNDNTISRRLAKWDATIAYSVFQNDILGEFTTGSLSHRVLFGMEYEYSHNTRKVRGKMYDPISLTNPKYSEKPSDIDSYKQSTNLLIRQSNIAFYAQDYIAINSKLDLLLGGRFDWIKEENENFIKDTKKKATPFAFSPRIALMYSPLKSLGLHASYSTSYVPVSGQSKEGTPFEPVRTKQWEVGIRKQLFNNSTIATLSLYHLTKNNLLTPDLDDPQFKIQIGEQYSRGIEFSIKSKISRELTLEGNYAYTEGEVSKTNDKKIPVGSKLGNVPKHMANLWLSYSLYEGLFKGLSFGGGCSYSSKRFGNFANNIILPSYFTGDAFVSYSQRNYRLALNIKNISDKRYYLGAQAKNLFTPAPPRSFVFSTTILF